MIGVQHNRLLILALVAGALGILVRAGGSQAAPPRNVILFVADGLRHDSINARDTPALWAIRRDGVHFEDSYSLFPTFTTANAASIATGHLIGDTGDFSNVVWAGHAIFETGNFHLPWATPVPFLENDQVIADLNSYYDGSYLGEETLLALARSHGYNTAAVGKLGPTAIQDLTVVTPVNGGFPREPAGIVVDDATGSAAGVPLTAALRETLKGTALPAEAPSRSNGYGATSAFNNGYSGDIITPGTRLPNLVQQQYFADVTTKAILPRFEKDGKPFALMFWSRDPDGTQHNQGDSLNRLDPGINGNTVHAAIQHADRNLQQILAWLDAHPAIRKNTDVFVTSDHGFATISRREIARDGRLTASASAQHDYLDAQGKVETAKGTLPFGFLAIDLARDLDLNLYDPDRRSPEGSASPFPLLRRGPTAWEHPVLGNGLIGHTVQRPDGGDAAVIVAANGGSDLVYVPNRSADLVRSLVGRLLTYDYVDTLFVDDRYGDLPGTLPFSAIGLSGAARLPVPALVVGFKVFYRNPADLLTAVQISDTVLREGQGMHGGFGRDSTYNNMAAIGPDFKRRFVAAAPVSNADIAPTLARVMGLPLVKGAGSLTGRVLDEALTGGHAILGGAIRQQLSAPAQGRRLLLRYREAGGRRYAIESCFVGANDDAQKGCRGRSGS